MTSQGLLRRLLASMAFRVQHAIRNAPEGFCDFEAGNETRTPCAILNHIIAILKASEEIYRGQEYEIPAELPWEAAIEKFHQSLKKLDQTLLESEPPDDRVIRALFQGPWLDAMTHVGQLMMLRRLAGAPVELVPYYKSDMRDGHLGPDQDLTA